MPNVPYRNILGALIYLSTRTRPDIATSVFLLGKFQVHPAPSNCNALKHLFWYLRGTAYKGIIIPYIGEELLDAYSNPD